MAARSRVALGCLVPMMTLLARGIPVFALLLTVLPAWAQDSKGVGVVTALTGKADLKRPQAPQLPRRGSSPARTP